MFKRGGTACLSSPNDLRGINHRERDRQAKSGLQALISGCYRGATYDEQSLDGTHPPETTRIWNIYNRFSMEAHLKKANDL